MHVCKCANNLLSEENVAAFSNDHCCCVCKGKVFDASLHMTNHYRRINSAKCVVNTSAPRCYNPRQKCSSDKGSTSRCSTASALSNYDCVPSRTNSNCEVRRGGRGGGGGHNHSNLQPACRSSSVPPRPVSKRNPSASSQRKPKPQMTKAPGKKLPPNIDTETNGSLKPHEQLARESTTDSEANLHGNEQSSWDRQPVPTPRTMLNTPLVASLPDYEYLQFSLRVTEDIIRNDLYSQREMRRVFNSHIEANRDRLSMTKMLTTIDNLCKELNISKKPSRQSVDQERFLAQCSPRVPYVQQPVPNSNILTPASKQSLMERLVSGQYEITDEDIRGFSEHELQQVITGIMSDTHVDEYLGSDNLRTLVVPHLVSSRSLEENVEIPQVSFRSSNTSSADMIEPRGNDENEMVRQASSVQVIVAAPSTDSVAVGQQNSSVAPLNDVKSPQLVCDSQLSYAQAATRKFSEENNNSNHDPYEEPIELDTLANDAGNCASSENRSRSLLAAAETVLKQVIWKIPSRSSAQEMQPSTVIVTSTPIQSASNVSVGNGDIPNSLLSVEASQDALSRTVTADSVHYDSSKHKSPNASLSVVQNIDERNISEESGAANAPVEQQIFANTGERKQHHEVSMNTENSVVDSCTQYDLVNMENCLELGIDKCTQTAFTDEEPQHLKVPVHTGDDSSSGVSVVYTRGTSRYRANEDYTVARCADTTSGAPAQESVTEVTPEASGPLLNGTDNVASRVVGADARMSSAPSSEFVSTIKQMLVDNVTALSEIMLTPRRSSRHENKDVGMSEGEISVTTSDRARMKSSKDIRNWSSYALTNVSNRCECKVLHQLKKYEHSQSVPGPEPTNISLSDYELKTCTDRYGTVGRQNAQYIFPGIGATMSLHGQRKFSSGRPLCSDGEVASSSAASDYDTRTDTS